MNSDYQQGQYPQQPYAGPPQPGRPGFPPGGGWQQMPQQPRKKKHRGLKIAGGTMGALIVLGIIVDAASGSGGSAPTTATQPDAVTQSSQAAAQPSKVSAASPAARKADAACQLLPTIEAQIKAGHYDPAQRDAQHAEDLASKETSLSSFEEVSGFGMLAMDLVDINGIDKSTVNADLATLTDDCK